AETRTRMEELAADAAIEANAAGDVVHVRTDRLTDIGNLIDEGDLRRQKRIGRVFDQFSGLKAGEENGRLDQIERPVELAHYLPSAFALGADDNAVGAHEVVDGRALAQEFRIGYDIEFGPRVGLSDDARNLAPGADGHGRLGDDHGVARQGIGDLT